MKYLVPESLISLLLLPFMLFGQNSGKIPDAQKAINNSKTTCFIENKGQWCGEVKYLARIGGMNAWITNSGVVYDYYKIIREYNPEETSKMPRIEREKFERNHTGIKGQVVAMRLEGVNKHAKSLPSEKQQGYCNYIIGNNSANWTSSILQYNQVVLEDIYSGIDIRYYFENGLLRYDYTAKPGADLSQITIKIEGSDGYDINEKGELCLKTSIGSIFHGKLYAYQQSGSIKKEVICSFTKNINGQIGLIAGNYNSALALVIDPLVYSTYIGGSGEEFCNSIAIDVNSNSYVTGFTRSANYPVNLGAYDTGYNQLSDVFVTKLNEPGTNMIYSTYIGGDSNEAGNSIVVDNLGCAYITGYTQSSNFPTTAGAFDRSYNGGSNFGGDAYVAKLNADGKSLLYSTFLGGSSNDYSMSIAIDASKNAFVTGYTKSSNYPITTGAYSDSLKGISTDIFVTKVNTTGTALIFSTFIGGSDDEFSNSIAIDALGNSFVTGYTSSSDYPTIVGAFEKTFNGGFLDAFVTKLNTTGTALDYSTFLGGSSLEVGSSIAVDNSGNAYITGYTISTNFPTTSGAYKVTTNGLEWDVFVTKLNSIGKALIYSTFLGGDKDDQAYSIMLDAKRNAFVVGKTLSPNYPTTKGAYHESYYGGSTYGADGFFTTLNSMGSALIYSTYIGGTDEDFCNSIALDVIGTAFITGNTKSTVLPTTTGAYDVSHNGDYDVFVSCFSFPVTQANYLSFKNITGIQADISWVNGTGTKRAVFIKKTTTGSALPKTDVTYIPNNSFSLGSQIDTTGWFCIFNDTGSSVVAKGLNPLTTYRVMVCEYIGLAGNEHYTTDVVNTNPANFTTIYMTPTIQASDIVFSNLTETSFTVNFTKGNGSKRVAFVKTADTGSAMPVNNTTYIANSAFGQGSRIGTSGWVCVYNDTGSSVNITKLQATETYRVMVCEYNGTPTKEQYLTDVSTGNPANQYVNFLKPTIQASNIIITDTAKTTVNFTYTRGNGTACLVLYTNRATPTYPPLIDNKTYTVNSEIGTSGWICIYKGSFNVYAISDLEPDSYRIMVCEFNGTPGFEKYNTSQATDNPNSFKNPNSIYDPLSTNISIYPNPTNGQFVIENAKGYYLKIFNTIGEEVYSDKVVTENYTINLNEVKDGVYFLRLEGNKNMINQKLILKR